jgi:hypothetical protein
MSHVLPWVESVNAAEWVIEGPTTDHDPRECIGPPSPVKAGFANAAGMEVVTYHLQDLITGLKRVIMVLFPATSYRLIIFIPPLFTHDGIVLEPGLLGLHFFIGTSYHCIFYLNGLWIPKNGEESSKNHLPTPIFGSGRFQGVSSARSTTVMVVTQLGRNTYL